MERGSTFLLKAAIILIGVTVVGLCIFWLPWMANQSAEMFPEYAYLKYPVLIGLYVTAIPFFYALYHALKILRLIDKDNAFSVMAVKRLSLIKICALTICGLYVFGSIILITQNALHPGIAIIGFTIIFAAVVIAVFATVLQRLLENALDIKMENDLTV
ncbi:DUF2975 domain-containing protein [Evansella tamaricis]|uniref:DUF2975 domain-containing protein n=1 Tax=Evansella tamaricis TaxID=2069301 RepID=A0ABS6JBZ6_9BACI|nr:DUF2975 domain-containing protein [Evansella tamaricis]MBU9711209.1 DUF2975 domain-containing protein [Evansella tamaricis]